MFMARLPAMPGDRHENHKRAIANAKERTAKESAYFADAKTRDAFIGDAQAQRDGRQILLEIARPKQRATKRVRAKK